MQPRLMHERRHRGGEAIERLAAASITLCGAGTVGANLAFALARQGVGQLTVIDHDRVEPGNLGLQPWGRADIGRQKAPTLAHALFRAVGLQAVGVTRSLTDRNAMTMLRGAHLVVDAFDNSAARGAVTEACLKTGMPCLHVGLSADYAEILWNEGYRVPQDAGLDVCDYPLARNLSALAVAVAAEVIVRFVIDGRREAYTLTLGDLTIQPWVGG